MNMYSQLDEIISMSKNDTTSSLPWLSDELDTLQDFSEPNIMLRSSNIEKSYNLIGGTKRYVSAIDSSSIILGKTSTSIMFAVKSTIVFPDRVERFGPLTFCISEDNKQNWYDHFIKKIFRLTKQYYAPPFFRMHNTIREFLERMTQLYVANHVSNSIILWDGSLGTGKTRFIVPDELLTKLLCTAKQKSNSVIAVSKTTNMLLSSGQPLLSKLDHMSGPIAIDLTNQMPTSEAAGYDILGSTFATKFTQRGTPFRVDIDESSSPDTLSDLTSSVSFIHGYPVPLRNAHVYAKIVPTIALACQKMLVSKSKTPLVKSPNLHKTLLFPYG